MALFHVVSVGFDRSETGPTKPCKLDDHIWSFFIAGGTDVDVRLFSHTNLQTNLFNDSSLQEYFDHKVVITHVGQSISIVVFTSMEHHFVLKQELKDLVGV